MRPGWGCGWVRGGTGAQRQLARCGGLGSCTFVVPAWHRLAPDLPGELRVIEVLLHHLHTAGEAVVGAASAAVEAVVVKLAASPPGMAWRRPWRCFKCLSSASGPCVFQYRTASACARQRRLHSLPSLRPALCAILPCSRDCDCDHSWGGITESTWPGPSLHTNLFIILNLYTPLLSLKTTLF